MWPLSPRKAPGPGILVCWFLIISPDGFLLPFESRGPWKRLCSRGPGGELGWPGFFLLLQPVQEPPLESDGYSELWGPLRRPPHQPSCRLPLGDLETADPGSVHWVWAWFPLSESNQCGGSPGVFFGGLSWFPAAVRGSGVTLACLTRSISLPFSRKGSLRRGVTLEVGRIWGDQRTPHRTGTIDLWA